MRKFGLALVVLFAVLLTGCIVADKVMGVKRDAEGKPTQTEGPAPINIIGELLGLGGLAAASRWVYVESAKRKVDKNFTAVVAGVETAIEKKKLDKSVIYPTITAASEIYSNRAFFAKSVKKIKDAVRSDRAGKRILNS